MHKDAILTACFLKINGIARSNSAIRSLAIQIITHCFVLKNGFS
jgi:hypothetical protein